MNKTVNLLGYLPAFLQDYKELKALFGAEQPTVQALQNETEVIKDNQYIEYCNAAGIEHFEKIANVQNLDDDTLDDRILRVKTKWNNELPYNYEYLFNQLIYLCGTGVVVDLNADEYTLTIKIPVGRHNSLQAVTDMVNNVVPCNIETRVTKLYNTYEDISKHKHNELAAYTYEQLRAEAIN